jgi:hypothetical protein
MEQRTFWEADRFSATEGIRRILCNPKFISVFIRPPFTVAILDQNNPIRALFSHLSNILSSGFRLGLYKRATYS